MSVRIQVLRIEQKKSNLLQAFTGVGWSNADQVLEFQQSQRSELETAFLKLFSKKNIQIFCHCLRNPHDLASWNWVIEVLLISRKRIYFETQTSNEQIIGMFKLFGPGLKPSISSGSTISATRPSIGPARYLRLAQWEWSDISYSAEKVPVWSSDDKPEQNTFLESIEGRLREECLNEHLFDITFYARNIINNLRITYPDELTLASLGRHQLSTPISIVSIRPVSREHTDSPALLVQPELSTWNIMLRLG